MCTIVRIGHGELRRRDDMQRRRISQDVKRWIRWEVPKSALPYMEKIPLRVRRENQRD